MANIMTHLGRDMLDEDGFWAAIKKWLKKRFPGWNW